MNDFTLTKNLAKWRWNNEIEVHGEHIYYKGIWIPQDEEYNLHPVPNFPKDVNACLEWLVPEIEELNGISFYLTTRGYYWTIELLGFINTFEGDSLAEAIWKAVK